MKLPQKVAVSLVIIIALLVATLLSSGPFYGRVTTTTSILISTSTQTETIFSTKSDTFTITTIQTSLQTSTTTVLSPLLSESPSILLTSARLIVVAPAGFSIYNATVVNRGTEAATNVSMVFGNYTSHSHVTNQAPLQAGQSTSFNFAYYGCCRLPGSSQPDYPALIYGTFQDGQPFAYVEAVELTCPQAPSLCP